MRCIPWGSSVLTTGLLLAVLQSRVEGQTDDVGIIALRRQLRRNQLATLMLAHGVPLLLAGDASATDPVCSLAPTRPKVDAILNEMNAPPPGQLLVKPAWLYRPNPA